MMPTFKLRKRTKNSLIMAALIAVCIALYWFDSEPELQTNQAIDSAKYPTWMASGTQVQHYLDNGHLQAKMTAHSIEFFEGDQPELILQQPEIEQGEVTANGWQSLWRATAQQGHTHALGESLKLQHDVNVYDLLHVYHLQSSHLFIDNKQQVLSSDQQVTVTGDNISLSSQGIHADWQQQLIDLTDQVRVNIETR